MPDHVHCLFIMNLNQSLTEIIRLTKGASSYFVNTNHLTDERFSWQNGYTAFSVSESRVNRTKQYIANQKDHHKE